MVPRFAGEQRAINTVPMTSNSRPQLTPLFFLLLLIGFYFPLFAHLDSFSLRIYDEARRAVNAFEMWQSGNFLVTTYEFKPEMWGTKPPLLIWCQSTMMRIFGPTVLAVRLPSALAGLATAILLFWFAFRKLGGWPAGLIASFALLTANAFLKSSHSARTGDFDGLLVLFCTSYLLAFFLYLENKQTRYLYFTGLGILLVVLTKSIAGLLFAPGLLLYLLIKSELLPLLRNRHFYINAILCSLGIAAFYLGREYYNPGYLQAVWDNELAGRYIQTLDAHKHPFSYYFFRLPERFPYFLLFSLLGIGWGFVNLRKGQTFAQRLSLYATLLTVAFLLVISNSSTKLAWYDLPVFPFLSLLAAVGWTKIVWKKLSQTATVKKWVERAPWLSTAITILLLVLPYAFTLHYCMRPDPAKYDGTEAYGHYIEKMEAERDYYVTSLFYRPDIRFYQLAYQTRGYNIRPFNPSLPPKKGSKVMVCGDKEQKKLKAAGDFDILHQRGKCLFVRMQ